MLPPNLSSSSLSPGMSLRQATQGLVTDGRSVQALKLQASQDPKAAVKEAAKQFEALFMQELMKSMRQSTLATGMLDNSATELGVEMLDAQYANLLTGMPRGLSEAIARQLEKQIQGQQTAQGTSATPADDVPPKGPASTEFGKVSGAPPSQVDFVQKHTEIANQASAITGIPANFMLAQAAHESGWGRREIKMPDGSSSFNVFGIKATSSWKGPVAEVTTTEYHNGNPLKVKAQFRAYDSYESAFLDYARMLKNNPRYSQVTAQSQTPEAFAQGLQRAGYATDPAYAQKLTRVIDTTMRLQRMMG